MRVVVQRKKESKKSIIGVLLVDDQEECYTLEPARTDPVNPGHPCIPAGTYELILTFSPHFKMITPEVLNVPGRTNIRIHPGNYPKDTLGCTLAGITKGIDAVYTSKIAFEKLMTLLKTTNDRITIEYREAPDGPV